MKRAIQLVYLTVVLAGLASAGDGTPPPNVPEIGASYGVAALGLLAGGLLIIRARRKR